MRGQDRFSKKGVSKKGSAGARASAVRVASPACKRGVQKKGRVRNERRGKKGKGQRESEGRKDRVAERWVAQGENGRGSDE